MSAQLETLVETLLTEGYALYPYTPTATKNATPTPFGIAYPPAYARALASTYDRLELRCVLAAPADAVLSAEVRFLAPVGEGHAAEAQRIELAGALVGALSVPARRSVTVAAAEGTPPLHAELSLAAARLADGAYEVIFTVANTTVVRSGLARGDALRRSLISTHPIVRVTGGRFISPLERPCASVNTFPVLATDGDDVVLGAAIVLPDHPQIAPESRGDLFDATEIEEALLLHLQVLSDGERAEIAAADPAVREMVQRAQTATPEDLRRLHGRTTLRDPVTTAPPVEPAGLPDPAAGEAQAELGGVAVRPGSRVRITPLADAGIEARMLAGRTARLERIMTAYDGRTHFGLTIEGDPGQALLAESGRLLYFFAPELEVIEP